MRKTRPLPAVDSTAFRARTGHFLDLVRSTGRRQPITRYGVVIAHLEPVLPAATTSPATSTTSPATSTTSPDVDPDPRQVTLIEAIGAPYPPASSEPLPVRDVAAPDVQL